MDIDTALIIVGFLACFVVFKTTRYSWVKVIIALVIAVSLAQLGINKFSNIRLPKSTEVAGIAKPLDPITGRPLVVDTRTDHEKLMALVQDKCILKYMKETPLSPLAYEIEFHNFLNSFQQYQTGGVGIGQLSNLLMRSFSDSDLSEDEVQALNANGHVDKLSLCSAFDKWMGRVTSYSEEDQQKIWQSLSPQSGQIPEKGK